MWRPEGWDATKVWRQALKDKRIDFKNESGWDDFVEAGADAILRQVRYNREVLWEVPFEFTDEIIEQMERLHIRIEGKVSNYTEKEMEDIKKRFQRRGEAEKYLRDLAYAMMYAVSKNASQFKGKNLILSLNIVKREG